MVWIKTTDYGKLEMFRSLTQLLLTIILAYAFIHDDIVCMKKFGN